MLSWLAEAEETGKSLFEIATMDTGVLRRVTD